MELKIDLSDREEIAAAVPLLQLILENTKPHACKGDGQCSKVAPPADNAHVAPGCEPFPPITLADNPNAAQAFDAIMGAVDPAAVFGKDAAAPVPPFPQGAPSTAVASQLPTAPVATLATSLTTPPSAPLPPAPPAPGTAAPTASDAAPTIRVLDVNGLPWDERIHSSSKAKLASGAWKYMRGVDAAKVQQVEAELRGQGAPHGTQVGLDGQTVLPRGVPPAPPGTSGTIALPQPPGEDAATTARVNAMIAAAPTARNINTGHMAPDEVTTFEQLMPRATTAVVAGKLPIMAVQDACVANGLVSIVALQQTPALVPAVWATLKQTYPEL